MKENVKFGEILVIDLFESVSRLIGKVGADRSHKWIYKEPIDNQDVKFLPTWHSSADSVSNYCIIHAQNSNSL